MGGDEGGGGYRGMGVVAFHVTSREDLMGKVFGRTVFFYLLLSEREKGSF